MYDAEFKGWLEPIENELDMEVVNLVFQGKFFDSIFSMAKIVTADDNRHLESIYADLQGISPTHFGINDFLLLNSEAPLLEYIPVDQSINLTHSGHEHRPVGREQLKKRVEVPPYQEAIELLREIDCV